MEYIQDFPDRFGTRPDQQWDIVQLINHSRVRRELECLGYVTVAFETGHYWTEWDDADYYIHRRAGAFARRPLWPGRSAAWKPCFWKRRSPV